MNHSALPKNAWYQNDNFRRLFPFLDVLILYISHESQDHGLPLDFECFKFRANFETEGDELLKIFDSSRQ